MDGQLDPRDYGELERALDLCRHTVFKSYLSELEQYSLIEPGDTFKYENAEKCVRLLHVREFACQKGEDVFQKLTSVYYASMALGASLIVMIDVKGNEEPADIYIGVRMAPEGDIRNPLLNTSFLTLKNGLESSFPGTVTEREDPRDVEELLTEIMNEGANYISSVSCVAAARDKSKTEDKQFVQGIEKFIDAMRGNPYTAIFLAEPVRPDEQVLMREGYESLFSSIKAFEKSTWSYNENASSSVMESLSRGISESTSESISNTQAHAKSVGLNIGLNASKGNSSGSSDSTSKPTAVSRFGAALSGAVHVLPLPSPVKAVAAAAGGAMQGVSIGKAIFSSISKSLGLSGSISAGYTKTESKTTTDTKTKSKSETTTSGTTDTKGSGRTIQIENVNKTVEEILSQLEQQLKRLKEGEDFGAYSCAAYFLSSKEDTNMLAASTYRSLMAGNGSSIESGAINRWEKETHGDIYEGIKVYLRRFVHPVFIPPQNTQYDNVAYTPGTLVSGLELPLHLGLPTKSVYGLPVLEYAEFGRNITYKTSSEEQEAAEEALPLGRIYHAGRIEEDSHVDLMMQNLTAHTFITGSTGSGKTNTVCGILDTLDRKGVRFLVVEPAKGEYRKILGFRPDVSVYGTNPRAQKCTLLRLNPFRFPETVHVLEHMDRLVEIFNVCWPMYAAMPAVLKDAVERAYVEAGWDLVRSENRFDTRLFPTFSDVLTQIRVVLRESEYSADNKSDYTGALVTRIRSLTTGINGLIFSNDDIPDENLFDRNAIVDLSRVGSMETRSLIMGLLVLKLQEYRMDREEFNSRLSHVTVLEEAHNLLKRTSTEQISESSNMTGKSVEMLANSIAEMRTFGEGFIIADQSPALLDMSAIRNTNTKIILRLPDITDRELVGKAAGLDEEQIVELGRLERGVAAVSQSNWVEPVLCMVNKYEPGKADAVLGANKQFPADGMPANDEQTLREAVLSAVMEREFYRVVEHPDVENLKERVIRSSWNAAVKREFLEFMDADSNHMDETFSSFLYDFMDAAPVLEFKSEDCGIEEWVEAVHRYLEQKLKGYSKDEVNAVMVVLIDEEARRDVSFTLRHRAFSEYLQQKGGLL